MTRTVPTRPIAVLFVLPPWKMAPPAGYGGIEVTAAALITALMMAGVKVYLCTPRGSTVQVTEMFESGDELFSIISNSYNDVEPDVTRYFIQVMRLARSLKVDVIHDFTGMLKALQLFSVALTDPKFPPVVHTPHGPLAGVSDIYSALQKDCGRSRLFYAAISHSQIEPVPAKERTRFEVIYNGIDLEEVPLSLPSPDGPVLVLGRFTGDKGMDWFIRYCARRRTRAIVAGPVAEMESLAQIEAEAALGPASEKSGNPDFKLYCRTRRFIDGNVVQFVGPVGFAEKIQLIAQCRMLVMPNRWHEPFGMVALEALRQGRPVLALRRGAIPEIVEHGVSGWLADNIREFCEFLDPRYSSAISPAACRQRVQDRFSMQIIALQWIDLYRRIISRNTVAVSTPLPRMPGSAPPAWPLRTAPAG